VLRPHPTGPSARRTRATPLGLAILATLAGVLTACAGGLGEIAIDAGRKFLLGTASQNYQADYSNNLEKLLDVLVKKDANQQPPPPPDPNAPPVTPPPPIGTDPAAVAPPPPMPLPVATGPLQVEVALLREVVVDGRPIPVPIEDGEILRDGFGRDEPGDNLRISVRSNAPCFLYVISIDATGWAQPLFPGPNSSVSNPIEGGRVLLLPETQWLYLDAYRGVETLYFVASYQRRDDLEQVLTQLAAKTRPETDPVARVDRPAQIARGFAGTRPGASTLVPSSTGEPHPVIPQSFMSQVSGADLVITRWFRHE